MLPPDVLLTGLEGQNVAGAALGVRGLADDAPGELADVLLAAGEDADVGAAEAGGTPRACPSPVAISALNAPGGLNMARAVGSQDVTKSAPSACALSESACASSM